MAELRRDRANHGRYAWACEVVDRGRSYAAMAGATTSPSAGKRAAKRNVAKCGARRASTTAATTPLEKA
jgi:hypothetical protein